MIRFLDTDARALVGSYGDRRGLDGRGWWGWSSGRDVRDG